MQKIVVGLFAVATTACSPPSDTTYDSANLLEAANKALGELDAAANGLDAVGNEVAAENRPTRSGGEWVYSSESDPMSDRKTEFACVRSTNVVRLGFPYGSPNGRLCLRNSPQFGRDAYVELEGEGQILCYSYRNCSVRIRFDDEEASSFSAVGPSDNSTDIVFIEARDRLERALKSADRTAVQLEFYQAGQQAFIFPTAGFDWEAHRQP